MHFLDVGGVHVNMDFLEAVDRRNPDAVSLNMASGAAYSFQGEDAEALRKYFTAPPPDPAPAASVPDKPVAFDVSPATPAEHLPYEHLVYECGCTADGPELPRYCPEHGAATTPAPGETKPGSFDIDPARRLPVEERKYTCGCEVSGRGLPDHCAEHGSPTVLEISATHD